MKLALMDWRKEKRTERKMFAHFGQGAVDIARMEGEYAAHYGKAYRNPYHAGRRHEAFKAGYQLGNPAKSR